MTAREAAFRLLALRDRSEADLRMRLEAKGYTAAEVDETVAELAARGLIEGLDAAVERETRKLSPRLTPEARSKKLLARLVRLGHEPADVIEALRKRGETFDE